MLCSEVGERQLEKQGTGNEMGMEMEICAKRCKIKRAKITQNSWLSCSRMARDSQYTVKTFGLLQPYFGHVSCMPVVYVTRYKLQGMLPIWLKALE